MICTFAMFSTSVLAFAKRCASGSMRANGIHPVTFFQAIRSHFPFGDDLPYIEPQTCLMKPSWPGGRSCSCVLSFAFFESSATAVKLVELPCFDRRFPRFVSVEDLSRGNTGQLDTVVGWRFEILFFSIPVLQCIKMDGNSSGVFRWSGPGHHLVSKDKCILIDNVI